MSLTVHYLLVHEGEVEGLLALLRKLLKEALEDQGLPGEPDMVEQYLGLRYSCKSSDYGNRLVSAFRLNADVEDEAANELLRSFEASFPAAKQDEQEQLTDAAAEGVKEEDEDVQILHILKFGDPLQRQKLAEYAEELFDLEMSLREALSTVFLVQYGDTFFDLLRDVAVKMAVSKKETPNEEQMSDAFENQLFYLLFGEYAKLGKRKETTVSQLIDALAAAEDFHAFKRDVAQQLIDATSHRDFIASLRERMTPIERLRNCVAHNRAIPNRTRENYEKAKQDMDAQMQTFFSSLSNDAT